MTAASATEAAELERDEREGMPAAACPPTTKQIKEALAGCVDTVSKKNGVFTVRRGYFYHHGATPEKLAAAIQKRIPGASIIDSGDQFVAFKASHTVRQGSHLWVRFTI